MDTAEEWANEWVTTGEAGVELGGVVHPPVRLIGHPNPALVAGELAAVREFVAAAIREGVRRTAAGSGGAVTDKPPLAGREEEVIRQLARGYANKEIAAQLQVSVKTVETYKARAMEKLGLLHRVDLVRYAARQGWLTDFDPPAGSQTEAREEK